MGKRWRKYAVGKYRLGSLFSPRAGRHEAVVTWTDDDGDHRFRLGVFTEEEGRAAVDRFAAQERTLTANKSPTIAELFALYREDAKKDGKLVENFDQSWRALGPRFGDIEARLVDADMCRRYAETRHRDGRWIERMNPETGQRERRHFPVSASTIWNELLRLRSCINWSVKRKILTPAEAPFIWMPSKPPGKKVRLSQEQVWDLIDATRMTPHLFLFTCIKLTTGARSAAILELKWDKVDFTHLTMDLRVDEPKNVLPTVKAWKKGRAMVPITEELLPILREHREAALTDNVIEFNGEPVQCVYRAFKRACMRAGLGSSVSPHTLRHTVASLAEDSGLPMLKISRLLGHKNLNTTLTMYAKPSAETLRPVAGNVRLGRPQAGGV